jgi:hypothetical protein
MQKSCQLYAPPALPPGIEPPVPIGLEAGWAQSQCGRCGVEKNLQPLAGNGTPAVQSVARLYTD